jgi:hypothetical protein
MEIFTRNEKEKHEKLLATFNALPVQIIYGVVDASGVTSYQLPPQSYWTLTFRLITWKVTGSQLRYEKLLVTKDVEKSDIPALRGAIKSKSLVTFHAKLCEDSPFGDARAQLVSLLEPQADNELELALAKYGEPVEILDPIIGKLVLNKSVNWYEGKMDWLGKPLAIAISIEENNAIADSLITAKALLHGMEQWTNKVNASVVEHLLELKNDNWLDEDEPPVTAQEFIERMEITSITASSDGAFEFWLNDGDLFWGHSIQVVGTLGGGLTSAAIAG